MAALNVFTYQNSTTVVALGVPNAAAIPNGSSPTTMLVTNLGTEAAYIGLTTAAATTTATAAAGSSTITVASATGIAIGQVVLGAGIASGVVIPAGYLQYPNGVQVTTVAAISGTTITLSAPVTAALSGTTLNFINPIGLGSGIPIMPNVQPIPLAIGSNTFIQTICTNIQARSILSVVVGV